MPKKTIWTKEQNAELKQLWLAKVKTEQISIIMKKSKNAIIGRASRLKLPRRQSATRGKTVIDRAKNPHHDKINKKIHRGALSSHNMKTNKSVPYYEIEHQAYGTPKQIIDLNYNECKWPIGDPKEPGFHFCGAVFKRGPYCDNHRLMAYRKPPEKGGVDEEK